MIQTFIIGIGGIVGMMLVWAGVQALWGKVFSEHLSDEDVLAGRTSCGSCGCTTACTVKRRNRAVDEESRDGLIQVESLETKNL